MFNNSIIRFEPKIEERGKKKYCVKGGVEVYGPGE